MKVNLNTTHMTNMTDSIVDVKSTSSTTADTSPILLSQTELLRFRFMPTLVQNDREPNKSVSGKLLYEKKHKTDMKFPSDATDKSVEKTSRGSVKVGDWMEFKLNTSETYDLYIGLKQLYDLSENIDAIPYGTATYTRIDNSFKQ